MILLAQANGLWEDVVRGLAGNGLWVFLSVMFLLEALKGLGRRYMQHRERMAMIEAGFNPADLDHNVSTSTVGGSPCEPEGTVGFRETA